MNSRIWSVVLQEIQENLRRRSYLLLTFGVPLLAVIAVAAITWYGSREPAAGDTPARVQNPVGYVDESGVLADPAVFGGALLPYAGEAAARAAVEAGEISAYYLVPADYLASGQVTRYAQQVNVAEGDIGLFEAFLLHSLVGETEPFLAARLANPPAIVTHRVGGDGAVAAAPAGQGMDRFWLVYVFGMLVMLTTFLTSGQLMQSVIKEKENRVIEVVLSSLRPLQLMAGKLIGQGVMGLLQIVTWLAALLLLVRLARMDVPIVRFLRAAQLSPGLLLALLLYFLLGFALFGAFAAAIGAIAANLREGPQYAVVYSLPAMLPIMLLPTIAEAPNSTLAVALSFFPLTSPMGMVERLVIAAVPGWQVALSLALLALAVAGGLWLAGRLFRVNTLLSGELPGRRQLWQLLTRG